LKNFKNNSLKVDLQNHQITIGSWLSIPSPVVAEIMAQAGYPWLVVDMEHSVIDLEAMQTMFLAMELNNCIPLVRLSGKDPNQAKRVLDAGAYGIIAPMINTVEDAELMIKAVKYPPWGTRGVGLARAQSYGVKFDDYKEHFNKHSVVILQIEHKDAVENIDGILSVKGVDAIIVGPYDLSGSYGIPGEFQNHLIVEAEQKILDSTKKNGIPAGIHVVHPTENLLQEKIKLGFKFIAYGVDMLFLASSSGQGMRAINNVLVSKKQGR
jgi:2-dehydro-3-deoxyglucarate aldolase